jgi:hypothetical protein
MITNCSYNGGSLLGFGLLITGLFLMLFAGVLFFTIILIPLAIIAGFIGLIILITGVLTKIVVSSPPQVPTTYTEPKYTVNALVADQVYSGKVKYCTACGIPNVVDNKFCRECGKKFLE